MRTIQVRIVGTITDSTQLDDLQAIAKIFVYEQRMKTIIARPISTIITPPQSKRLIHTIYHPPTPQQTLCYIRGFA